MHKLTSNIRLFLLPLLLTLAPLAAQAAHPAYLHALVDLRHARAHLQRAGGGGMEFHWDEGAAIREIDRAIHEIKEASIDDGKNIDDHPPVDLRAEYSGRVHRALELLRKARADCDEEEDNGFARGLRNRALRHINEAIRLTEEALHAAHHP
jgi:hypothetical protein